MADDGTRTAGIDADGRLVSVATEAADAVVVAVPSARGPRIAFVNAAFTRMTGYEPAEVVGRTCHFLQGDRTDAAAVERIRAGLRNGETVREELVNYRKDGSEYWVELTISPVPGGDGSPAHWVSVQRETTQRRFYEQALQRRALRDPLTDLPNRSLFNERLQQALTAAQRGGRPLALVLLDLDRFKDVNDTFGHAYGDLLLREVALRLRASLRPADTLARLSGDEFALVLPDTDAEGAKAIARRLIEHLGRPLSLQGTSELRALHIGASAGIAVHPDHADDAETILRRADIAMYLAKRGGGGYELFSPDHDHYSATRLSLVGELHSALAMGELRLYFQPEIELKSGRFVRAEARVRWQHPERGLLAPAQFVPVAQQSGVIRPLTNWVIEQTLSQCRAWRESGLQVPVSVNLSMQTLHDPELIDRIAESLAEHDIPPPLVRFEVNESTLVGDCERTVRVLSRLRETGVGLAVGNFGTGPSSLAYLTRLPIDAIKIDQQFVRAVREGPKHAALVRSTVDLGHALDLRVTAEGVEHTATADLLRTAGCDHAQGFLFGRPMPAAEFANWLARAGRGGSGRLLRTVANE